MESSECFTISLEEAVKRLGIGRALGYRLAAQGRLPGLLHLGKKYRIAIKALEAALSNGYSPGKEN
jgi:excisionase family DNA binding protein